LRATTNFQTGRRAYTPRELIAGREASSVNMGAKHNASPLLADAYIDSCHQMNRYANIPKTLYLSLYLAVPSLGRWGTNMRGIDLRMLHGERAGGLGRPWDCGVRAMSRLFVQQASSPAVMSRFVRPSKYRYVMNALMTWIPSKFRPAMYLDSLRGGKTASRMLRYLQVLGTAISLMHRAYVSSFLARE
jgi:hypothetical protein